MNFFALVTIGTLFVGMGYAQIGEIINQESADSSAVTTPQLFEEVIAGNPSTSLSFIINGSAIYAFGAFFDCEGDLDDDGTVGVSDLLELFIQWGTDGSADLDDDGDVDTYDMLLLFYDWGPC